MTDTFWHTTCVRRCEMTTSSAQTKHQLPHGTWRALAQEIGLRLERTPITEALRIQFPNAVLARRAYFGLRYYWQADQVGIRRQHDVLFVFRGPEYVT